MAATARAQAVTWTFAALAVLAGRAALAQQGAAQTLDTVQVVTPTAAVEMQFNAPRPPDFVDYGIAGTSFRTCKLSAAQGLYCLDGDTLRRWPNPRDPSGGRSLLSCRAALGPAAGAGDACTGMTVDPLGSVWLAGSRAGSTAVVKVVPRPAGSTCSGLDVPGIAWRDVPDTFATGTARCAADWYTGRGAGRDLDFVPAGIFDAARGGVIAIEGDNSVAFYPDAPAPVAPLAFGPPEEWGASHSERYTGATWAQVVQGDATYTFAVAVTSGGRVIAREKSLAYRGAIAYFIPAATQGVPGCGTSAGTYAVRASSTTGLLYATDQRCNLVMALRPQVQFVLPLDGSAPAPALFLTGGGDPVGSPLQLSTADPAQGTFPPEQLTVSPGIPIDMDACRGSCTFLTSRTGKASASLVGVQLAPNGRSGLTMFRVTGIPDCRYRDQFPAALAAQRALCDATPDAVVDPYGAGRARPGALFLNVTPLLPKEITSLFDSSGVPPKGLPALLISPEYRASIRTRGRYTIDALFAVTEEGVQFNDTFVVEFDIPLLLGLSETADFQRRCQPSDNPGEDLLRWDVTSKVSERWRSVPVTQGGSTFAFTDVITNVNCRNPSMSSESSFSLMPYTLELAPDTYDPATRRYTAGNDAVFARLVQSLYGDLETVRDTYACRRTDVGPANGAAPIAARACSQLRDTWENGKAKLDKCVAAAFRPKASKGDENCQSFLSQLDKYRSLVPATTPACDVTAPTAAACDPANRVGELKSRVDVIRWVFGTRFLPSIPAKGFCRETSSSCPDPWP